MIEGLPEKGRIMCIILVNLKSSSLLLWRECLLALKKKYNNDTICIITCQLAWVQQAMENTDCLKYIVFIDMDLMMIILKLGILTKGLIEALNISFYSSGIFIPSCKILTVFSSGKKHLKYCLKHH